MTQRFALPALALASAALGVGAFAAYRAVDAAAIACRVGGSDMARLELLFGLGKRDGTAISEAEWTAFLDAEVTPRFPAGLTVLTAYGQWRGESGALARETSRVLLVWYLRAADSDAKIEAIRAAYKTRFAQESVMRVDSRDCVSFN